LVSAGIYGWPFRDAVTAAIETLGSTPTQVQEARIVAFDARAFDELERQLGTGQAATQG
jgi:O-acetyl-ADP-ribose deacetylase (regulator of RNase III)